MIETLRNAGFEVYPDSIAEAGNASFCIVRRGEEKLVAATGAEIRGGAERIAEVDGGPVIASPLNRAAAEAVRRTLPWTAPRCVGLKTSAGLGDRLGLATPGHIRAIAGKGIEAVLAQQSIREMARTHRTPEDVMDAATFGVLQEGFRDGFGSDADHLQRPEDIDATAEAGFTMFTIDPGAHVVNEADSLSSSELETRFAALDFETLQTTPAEMKSRYDGKRFALNGGASTTFRDGDLLRAAVKYGSAVAHTVKMYRHLCDTVSGEFELEVSVDETDSPTSTAEHYFFAAELKRLDVEWVSMAPRFVGRFEKGVDYIGDLDAFRASFAEHVAVMHTLGPYKISIHSGSDKFSIYPIVTELTGGLVHLKTAGTSYLEALRAMAQVDPALYREILDFARGRYETDKATYHVSADVGKVPAADSLSDQQLPALLDDFNARQVFHVTYGSVLTVDDGERFRGRIYNALEREESTHYDALERHLARHIAPLTRRP